MFSVYLTKRPCASKAYIEKARVDLQQKNSSRFIRFAFFQGAIIGVAESVYYLFRRIIADLRDVLLMSGTTGKTSKERKFSILSRAGFVAAGIGFIGLISPQLAASLPEKIDRKTDAAFEEVFRKFEAKVTSQLSQARANHANVQGAVEKHMFEQRAKDYQMEATRLEKSLRDFRFKSGDKNETLHKAKMQTRHFIRFLLIEMHYICKTKKEYENYLIRLVPKMEEISLSLLFERLNEIVEEREKTEGSKFPLASFAAKFKEEFPENTEDSPFWKKIHELGREVKGVSSFRKFAETLHEMEKKKMVEMQNFAYPNIFLRSFRYLVKKTPAFLATPLENIIDPSPPLAEGKVTITIR